MFARGNERWNGSDYSGRTILPVHSPFKQSLEISSPSRESVYFLAPGKHDGKQLFNSLSAGRTFIINLRSMFYRQIPRRPTFQLQPRLDVQTEYRRKQSRTKRERRHFGGWFRYSYHASDLRTRKPIAFRHGNNY